MAMGCPLMNDDGADQHSQGTNMFGSLLSFLALDTGFIDDYKGQWIACDLEKVAKLGQCLNSK
jgi:hypothetical protein